MFPPPVRSGKVGAPGAGPLPPVRSGKAGGPPSSGNAGAPCGSPPGGPAPGMSNPAGAPGPPSIIDICVIGIGAPMGSCMAFGCGKAPCGGNPSAPGIEGPGAGAVAPAKASKPPGLVE